jgi:hypothetical protein
MTEQEWLQDTDPQPMLEYLRGKASDRKFRLFAVACCRRIWNLLADPRSRRAVRVAECHADSRLADHELAAVVRGARRSARGLERQRAGGTEPTVADWAYQAAALVADGPPHQTAEYAARASGDGAERQAQADLLRCIFGPIPFRSVSLDPAWLTWHDGLLVSMARQMYDSRDFRDMPILADALEEAGCQDQDILDHCRSGGEHVRGCWVVDGLLGKE